MNDVFAMFELFLCVSRAGYSFIVKHPQEWVESATHARTSKCDQILINGQKIKENEKKTIEIWRVWKGELHIADIWCVSVFHRN